MELHDALAQISEIHGQMARTRIFRGYRAATTAFTGLVAIAAAGWQAWAIPHPILHPYAFVSLWVSVAIVCLVVMGAEIALRYRRSDSTLDRELTVQAIQQFLPCIVAGGLVTLVLCNFVRNGLWLLPGLWSIFFGLGLLASRRLLPGAIVFIGAFYLLCGLICLAEGQTAIIFSPWMMGLPFGAGQLAAAVVLHWTLERRHESK